MVTATDASVLRGITTDFLTGNGGVLVLLSCFPSVLLMASESVCKTVSRFNSSVYSEIIAILQLDCDDASFHWENSLDKSADKL